MKRTVVLAALVVSSSAFGQATRPVATGSSAGSAAPEMTEKERLSQELRLSIGKYGRLLPSWGALADPGKREAMKGEIVPLLRENMEIGRKLAGLNGTNPHWATTPPTVVLLALGDEAAVAEVNTRSASADAETARYANAQMVNARLLTATSDSERIAQVDALASLLNDAAGKDDGLDRMFMRVLSAPYLSKEVKDHAREIVPKIKAGKFTSGMMTAKEGEDRVSGMIGKPFVMEGKTVDGKPFSTAQWKGKVIIVDFWASWCGPCKAELPRVKALFEKYHSQGLEVLGVSSDYTKGALVRYLEREPLPWGSLFDEEAAKGGKWHPLTGKFGITGIPVMFAIDRQGRLRSVTARSELEKLIPQLLGEK